MTDVTIIKKAVFPIETLPSRNKYRGISWGQCYLNNGDTLSAADIGLTSIEALFLNHKSSKIVVTGSVTLPGSLNNSATLSVLDYGSAAHSGSIVGDFLAVGRL